MSIDRVGVLPKTIRFKVHLLLETFRGRPAGDSGGGHGFQKG
jgi:hypothetical protein